MESLERARARQSQRLNENILEPIEVRSVGDIKRVVAELDPAKNPVAPIIPLSTQLEVQDGNKKSVYSVTTNTQSKSKRDHLIEGLKVVQKRIESELEIKKSVQSVEINGRVVTPPKLGSGVDGHIWVDPLIRQWLGASRDGITIYWDLDDGFRYKYDIFQHRLTRVSRQDCGDTASSIPPSKS